ncbi:hypothetical protein JMJ77_0010797 [Colletotrichum scovillei]|uniref:Uncharacterized protein n=1 Tax=Colletotrichum scovillei TaxID=1209932 RepID=A0A9P7R0Z8_9PEZI|nr:hypothetical protein JMJ77_0010797 [Colletotrichum scovillei]KAG7059764.1 hypothetical protein JMJ78_0015053 [Colletotrichum scovillei]KAG7067210.1 hypothetical protein JMJ76_0008653 [Colletotrichum scovillei]
MWPTTLHSLPEYSVFDDECKPATGAAFAKLFPAGSPSGIRSMTATCYSARAYATTGSSPAAQRRADGNASSRCQKPQPLGISVDRRPCPWVSPVGRSLVKTYHNMAP